MSTRSLRLVLLATALVALLPWTPRAVAVTTGQRCEKDAASALRRCGAAVSKQELSCERETSAACAADDPKRADALSKLETKVLSSCPDAAALTSAGYPAVLTPAGLVAKLQETCSSEAASLAARSFGGPQSAARSAGGAETQRCLDYAFDQGRKLIDYALARQSRCLLAAHAGRACDVAATDTRIRARRDRAAVAIGGRCGSLQDLVAVTPALFAGRALDQAACMVATAHGRTPPLDLACGPRVEVAVPARATNTQLVLPSAIWGTRCGDGTDYAFWIRLAPEGSPINKVVVFTQGGGSCVDGPDCAATAPSLFNALGDTMVQNGIMSSSDATNPFRDWTKVFLPYCTQDGHTGSGIINRFPEMTVYRYGAVNLRAAMRYLRDVLWTAMDASDPEGFRPDRLLVLFSGSSAGGIGVQFNYHYLLDDLRWVHSTLLADSALGVDNGAGAAVQRGQLVFAEQTPGWAAEPMAPPYCHDPTCAEGWNRFAFAQSARLRGEPEQMMLSLSNQADNTQESVGQFASQASFINAVRARYCEQRGANGLHSFLSATTTPTHGNIAKDNFDTVSAGGVLMRDWIATAMTSPTTLADAVSEGTLVADYPGVSSFACPID